MADGYLLQNEYPWYHGNSISQSTLSTNFLYLQFTGMVDQPFIIPSFLENAKKVMILHCSLKMAYDWLRSILGTMEEWNWINTFNYITEGILLTTVSIFGLIGNVLSIIVLTINIKHNKIRTRDTFRNGINSHTNFSM